MAILEGSEAQQVALLGTLPDVGQVQPQKGSFLIE